MIKNISALVAKKNIEDYFLRKSAIPMASGAGNKKGVLDLKYGLKFSSC